MFDEGDDEGDDDKDLIFDSVCVLCDNGGELLWYAYNFFFFELCLDGKFAKDGFENLQLKEV